MKPDVVTAGLVSVVAFASIPIVLGAGALTLPHLYAVAFVNGCAAVVCAVGQQAALPSLVSEAHIGAAGQAETIERLAAVLGPFAAVALIYEEWPAAPFAVDALSFAVIAFALLFIRADLGPSGTPAVAPSAGLLVGARSLWRNRLLRDLTVLNSAGDLLFAGIGLLMIVLVRESGEEGVSIGLVFSSAAVGGLIGSLVAHRVERSLGLATAVIGKHVLTAALFPLLLLELPAWCVALLWASISFQVSIVAVIQRTHVLLGTSADVMGRVQSFTTFLSFGSLPVGVAGTGLILEAAGGDGTVVVYTGALAVLAVWSATRRSIRAASNRDDPGVRGRRVPRAERAPTDGSRRSSNGGGHALRGVDERAVRTCSDVSPRVDLSPLSGRVCPSFTARRGHQRVPGGQDLPVTDAAELLVTTLPDEPPVRGRTGSAGPGRHPAWRLGTLSPSTS